MKFRHKSLMGLIYCCLLALPFVAILSRVIYVQSNKNAYQSASITQTQYKNVEIENVYTLVRSIHGYNWDDYNISNIVNGRILYVKDFVATNGTDIDDYSITTTNFLNSNTTIMYDINPTYEELYVNQYYDSSSFVSILFNSPNFDYMDIVITDEDLTTCEELIEHDYLYTSNNTYYEIREVQATTLDNVFEYSVNKLENSELFTWTQNTAVYTGVNAMTTSLQIQGTAIPMLITYWFLLTVIYVILDIVIKLFTVLTHLIGSKATEK